jgi:hypothetical protein
MKSIACNARPTLRGRLVFALSLVAVSAVLSISLGTGAALANGGCNHRSADVTFTKWITTLPAGPSTLAGVGMAGVVAGDVGPGRFAGLVIGDDTTSQPGFWLGHARYEFHGRDHTFVADVHITQNNATVPITATISGVVTDGWLKGARVSGMYRQWDSCPIPTPGNVLGSTCFQGTLHLQLDHWNT